MLRTAIPLTQQDQARQRRARTREDLAEVGVGGHQNPVFAARQLENVIIDVAGESTILDMDHVVPGLSQQRDDTCTAALVDQELHAGVRSGS